MRYAKFKEHTIQRTCTEQFNDYRKYRPFLSADFHERCCYCNMSERILTTPFHVDHFIPEKAFNGKRDNLKTDYNNLMWACPKCNLSKGSSYEGDLEHDSQIVNRLFYNPVETDYNEIFYRNELGGIDSDDPKGRKMIKLLKLYRPVHNLSWLLERLEKLCGLLENQAAAEKDPARKQLLESAAGKAARECVTIEQLFRAVYMEKKDFRGDEHELT